MTISCTLCACASVKVKHRGLFYLNSMMSVPYYVGDNIVGLAYGINYFSSYNNPLGIVMSTKGQYFIYLLIRIVIALILIPIVYLPLKLKKTNNE